MTVHSRAAAAILAAAALIPSPSFAQARVMTLDDFTHSVALRSPQLSPDGKRIAVVVSRANMTDDRYDSEIDLVDVATHARRTLTYDRKGLGDVQWSPDGTRLAFMAQSGSGDEAKSQVFVMPMDGGDARPVTHAPEGVDQFIWRPDGNAVAYVAPDAKPKLSGAAKYRDSFVVGRNPITAHELPPIAHLWLQPFDGRARQLTHGTTSAATGEGQSSLSFSPDGRTLAYVQTPNAVLDESLDGHIMLLDVASGAQRRLTANARYEGGPEISPDGRHVVYEHSLGDNQITLNEAYLTTTDGGNGTAISHSLDRPVSDLAWAPDGSLMIRVPDATSGALYRYAPAGTTPERVDLGDLVMQSQLDGAVAKDGTLAFVGSTTTSPPELYVRRPGGSAEKLTDYNARQAALALGSSRRITFPTSNGMTGDAVLTMPPHPAAKMPLVLYIHGGPTSSSTQTFDRAVQLMAARGWLVLEPNYRGSDNLGLAYQAAVRYDPEEGPGKDVMAAVDAVRKLGIVDDRRIAVGGWSYGGIMTAWLVTHYHIWRAAVSGASVNDWTFDYSVADDSASDAALFHGSPFRGDRAEYDRASAVFYVKNVTSPVLILSDVGDNRDPIATSYVFYHALKDNGKDVTFVAWPVAGHFPRDPVRATDVYTHWIDFIGDHLR